MKKRRIRDLLKVKKKLVADGAWGTSLQNMGLEPGQPAEYWNLEYPEKVYQVAESFVNAGADIIETNSFGGSRIKLRSYGLDAKTAEINRIAASISSKAAGKNVIVAGSIGPTGKFVMTGDISKEELFDLFSEQAAALEEGGADAAIIETFYDSDEIEAAVTAVKQNSSLEIIASLTWEKNSAGTYRSMMGLTPAQAYQIAIESGADIIGSNCGAGYEQLEELTDEVVKLFPDVPILLNPNAGLPVIESGRVVYGESAESIAGIVERMYERGASIIGGCCGTTPDHIKTIRRVADKYL